MIASSQAELTAEWLPWGGLFAARIHPALLAALLPSGDATNRGFEYFSVYGIRFVGQLILQVWHVQRSGDSKLTSGLNRRHSQVPTVMRHEGNDLGKSFDSLDLS